ncbi:MAG TPA: hypothetical protein VEP90_02065, partial [Methylomirabilota bacterium]|nr:hypothetical protein [Methylomirabilota bacterium]
MRFGKKTLFSLLLGFDLLANMLELTHVNFLYTTTLISFCTYILLPGFLISLILRIRKLSFWENLLFIVGLSIAFLEFGGLLLNILLPLFGVENPLAFQNIVFGFDIYILLLFIFAWRRTKQFVVQIQLPRRSNIEKAFYVLPVFFPVLATLGAIVLNNGGSNILTLILLGAIAVYSLLLVLFRDKIAVDLYPYAIFFIGIASLFTTSLRSWYISGHDIEIEFYVFQLTNTHHIWNMAFFQDTYNACLSITILPTILTNLLAIPDMYVYKVIFQILFATSPVLVFFIVRNYTTPVFAFLSAFLFMSFPTFFSDMPMLNRQEIGFIFFGLALYMMLERNRTQQFSTKSGILPLSELSFSMRRILFIIFALSVIVSHYSTNFVLLGLIAFVYVLTLIISRSFMKNTFALSMRRILLIVFALSVIFSHDSTNFVLLGLIAFVYVLTFIISRPFMKNTFASLLSKTHITLKNTFPNKMFLNLPLILILFVMTYFWNTFYTHSSNNAGSVVLEVANSMLIPSSTDARSSDLSNSIFFAHHSDPKQELQDYINRIRQSAESQNTGEILASKFYSKSIISKYPINPISQEQLAPTPLGNLLSSFHIPVFNIQAELRSLSAYFMQIFVFIGLLAIFFLKNKKLFDLQYLLLCFGAVLLLALITILPALSVEYGVLRMFQQLLFMLSLPIVLGFSSILFFMKEQKRI